MLTLRTWQAIAALTLSAMTAHASEVELRPTCRFAMGLCGYVTSDGAVAIEPRFEWAGEFSEGLAPVRYEGKFGYIDRNGTLMILPRFDDADRFRGGAAAVKIGDMGGVIDTKGTWVIEPDYRAIERHLQQDLFWGSKACKPTKQRRNDCIDWQLLNARGAKVTAETFDSFQPVASRLRSAELDQGLAENHLYVVTRASKAGVMRPNGTYLVSPSYDYVAGTADGRWFHVRQDKMSGLLDADARLVIPIAYDFIALPRLAFSQPNDVIPVRRGALYGFMNVLGEWVLDPQFEDGLGYDSNRKYYPRRKGGRSGILDRSGKTLLQFGYDFARWCSDDRFLVKMGDTWQLLDGAETVLRTMRPELAECEVRWPELATNFEFLHRARDGSATVVVASKYGHVDVQGRWIVPPLYDGLRYVTGFDTMGDEWGNAVSNSLLIAFRRNPDGSVKSGLLNATTGEPLLPFVHEYLEQPRDGLMVAKKEGKFGYIDARLLWAIEPQFDRATAFNKGRAWVHGIRGTKYSDPWCVIDKSARVIECLAPGSSPDEGTGGRF